MINHGKEIKAKWNSESVSMDFDLCSMLEKFPAGQRMMSKYFPGVWDIFKLNDICSSYLHRKNKEKSKPTEGNVRDCLNKISEVLAILQETTYPLYLLKIHLNKAITETEGPLAANLRKTVSWLNSKIYDLENSQLDNDTIKACADAAKDAAAEIYGNGEGDRSAANLAEKRLIADIAELYQNIHGEWPLRDTLVPVAAGPLDEILASIGGILGCGTLVKLIDDFETDLRQTIEKELAVTKNRGEILGSKNLIG